MKIAYEFYKPDVVYEIPEDDVISQSIATNIPCTFRKFLNSSKVLINWDGHNIKATKKLKNKCYFLTDKFKVLEFRVKI